MGKVEGGMLAAQPSRFGNTNWAVDFHVTCTVLM